MGNTNPQLASVAWIAVAIYCAAILFIVVRGALRTRTLADYAVGSAGFSPVAVGLSLAVSMMSAATFIINPGLIALYGVSGVVAYAVVLPAATLLSFVVLTKGFRRRGRVVKATTMAQWIGARYNSPGYAIFFGVLSLLLITFIVLICVGLTKVLSRTLGTAELYTLVVIVVFIFGYMMFGGANSMVYTNTIQAGLMIVVAVMLLGSGHEHFREGLQGFWDRLRSVDPRLVGWTNPSSFLFRDLFEIVACQAIIGVAIVCQPHILTKSFFLRSDRDVNRYLAVSVSVVLLFFMVVFVGLYARLAFPDLTVGGARLSSDGIVTAYVLQEFSVYAAMVVVMGLLAAGISTLEGLIQSVSTTITADLVRPLLERLSPRSAEQGASSSRYVWINRGVIGLLGVVSVVLSHDQLVDPDLSVAIFAQNGVYAFFSAAFVPVLFGTFLRGVPRAAPVSASMTAMVVHFSIYYGELTWYMQAPVKNPGVAGALAIVSSICVGLAVLMVSRARAARGASPMKPTEEAAR